MQFVFKPQYEGFALGDEEKMKIILRLKVLSNKEEKEYDFKANLLKLMSNLMKMERFSLFFILGNEHKSGYFNLEEINKLFGS